MAKKLIPALFGDALRFRAQRPTHLADTNAVLTVGDVLNLFDAWRTGRLSVGKDGTVMIRTPGTGVQGISWPPGMFADWAHECRNARKVKRG